MNNRNIKSRPKNSRKNHMDEITEADELNKNLSKDLQQLEHKIKLIQNNKRILRRQILELQNTNNDLLKELARLTNPPLVTGFVEELLLKEKLALVRSTTGTTYVVSIDNFISNRDLKLGSKVSLNQRHFSIINVLPTIHDSFISGLEVLNDTDVSYNEIGGLDQIIQDVKDAIQLPFEKPDQFKRIGINPPRGLLFYGPPGSGKTLVAKAVAHETNCTFINVIGSSLVQTYLGEGIRLVRELFEFAEEKSPAIIFIDELDTIGSKREITTAGDLEVQRILIQLLSKLDGFKRNEQIKIIGSTNRIDVLDPALIRPGRFDRLLYFPLPDKTGRKAIFSIYFKKMNLDISKSEFEHLIDLTEGFSGADIKNLCSEAGIQAIRDKKDVISFQEVFLAYNNLILSKKSSNDTKNSSFF